MNKHILGEHLATWHKWKSANVAFDSKKLHQEKSKSRYFIGYGAITNHFGNGKSYKKDDARQHKFMEDYYCCCQSLRVYLCFRKLVAKAFGHVLESKNCVFKPLANVQHAILSLVAKTMEQYGISILDSCIIATTSFDLWMFL
jgi:hypothetical protein